ncbi:MAG: class I SAM-dependent methyltransferase [Ignavibacteriae bacterium]|nr:MAG: class I SAM-dependent methyltransferase [Ignavibacteriota bacterium]
MAPTIKKATEISPEKFYDRLAAEYDGMTGFEQRFPYEQPFFRMIRDRFQLKTALDAGCGTGFHSILLGRLGLKVTATDISEEMLTQTRRHAKENGIHIKTIKSKFPGLKKAAPHQFDSVFCLGNTCAHLLTEEELLHSLSSFYGVLNRHGVLILQLLNYNRILAQHERIQNIKEADGKTFIRFYDYENKLIRFNILTLEKNTGSISHSLKSVMLRPWKPQEIIRCLRHSGFDEVNLYGSIALDRYQSASSKDAVFVARRETSFI